jgi:cytochrome c553
MVLARWTRTAAAGALLAASLLAGGCNAPGRAASDPFTATGELIALSGGDSGGRNACFTCHGLDGVGNGAGAPRLAGLEMGYIQRQLEGYASGLRRHPEMEYIARQLSANERRMVAAHYAGLPSRGSARPAPPVDAPLYLQGDPARGLEPCAVCHGRAGEGIGRGNPALAGQPAPYLEAQLHAWRLGKRRNDPGNLMQAISRRLTPDEIRSLAAHAAALPVAANPESREASP